MLNRSSLLAAIVLAACFYGSASAQVVSVPQLPYKNPGVLTLGTLSIANRVDFAVNLITSNGNKAGGKLTILWDWGDGTPVGTGANPNHTYLVPGNYTVKVQPYEDGVPALTVLDSTSGKQVAAPLTVSAAITDAIKSSKLQTNEKWSSQNGDNFTLTGTDRIPNVPLNGQLVFCDIGGVQLSFILNSKGIATLTSNNNVVVDPSSGASLLVGHTCKASLKVFLRKRSATDTFVDSKFILKFNGFVQDAFAFPATITNRDASRDNVRITCKMTFNPPNAISILYQSGINQVFTSRKGQAGKTR
jgi:hypothetical protein